MKTRTWLAGGMIAIVAAGIWTLVVGPRLASGGASAPVHQTAQKLPPLPWQAQVSAAPPAQPKPPPAKAKSPAPAPAAPVDPVTGMPAASAGTNGSYTPPTPAEQKRVYTRTHPVLGSASPGRTAILLNRTALAPAGAPDEIKEIMSAANLIVGQPYRLGGGHASWRSAGYDCSGAVSFALAGAGLVPAPLTSGQFMSWGAPGPGRWLTIYANSGHVYAVVAGLRWDTVGDARGSGPRWHPFDAYPSGFAARHFPGL